MIIMTRQMAKLLLQLRRASLIIMKISFPSFLYNNRGMHTNWKQVLVAAVHKSPS
jgi:hypothetical protein